MNSGHVLLRLQILFATGICQGSRATHHELHEEVQEVLRRHDDRGVERNDEAGAQGQIQVGSQLLLRIKQHLLVTLTFHIPTTNKSSSYLYSISIFHYFRRSCLIILFMCCHMKS